MDTCSLLGISNVQWNQRVYFHFLKSFLKMLEIFPTVAVKTMRHNPRQIPAAGLPWEVLLAEAASVWEEERAAGRG